MVGSPSRVPEKTLLWVVLALLAAPIGAQDGGIAELESRLPSLTGLARALALAELTDAHRGDNPRQAVEYGREALELLAVFPDPVAEVVTLNEMGWAYMFLGDYELAIQHAERGRDRAREHGDQKGLSRALNNLGVIARRQGDPTLAIERFSESLEIRRALGDPAEIAMSLNNLGFVYSTDFAEYDLGLEYHLEALEMRERLGARRDLALSLNNIGVVSQRLGDHERALAYFTRALELRRELGLKQRVAATLQNIGELQGGPLGDHQTALDLHLEALEIRRAVGEKSGVAQSLFNIAIVYLELDRLDLAREYLTQAWKVAETLDEKPVRARILLGLAALHQRRGELAEAEGYARQALEAAREASSKDLVQHGLRELAAIQEQAGSFGAALDSFKQFKEVSDQILDEEKVRRIELLRRRYQAERHEREIDELTEERAVREIELSGQRARRNLVAGAAVLLGIGGFLVFWRRVELSRQAQELSVTDSLTGLGNRRYVLQTVEPDLATSRRRHREAASRGLLPENADLLFLMIDIDHFKAVNDQLGHAAGDRVLVQVGELLRQVCRESDSVARWGGEEFLAVSRFTDRREAGTLAERVRGAFETHSFELGSGRRTRCTCSIGFAVYPFSPAEPDALGWEQVVDIGDEALYAAKSSGRNAWVGLASTETTRPETLADRSTEAIERSITRGELIVETSAAGGSLRWRGATP